MNAPHTTCLRAKVSERAVDNRATHGKVGMGGVTGLTPMTPSLRTCRPNQRTLRGTASWQTARRCDKVKT